MDFERCAVVADVEDEGFLGKIEGFEFDLEKFTRGQDELLTGLLTNGPDKKILKVFL